MLWLLSEGGASIFDATTSGKTVWTLLGGTAGRANTTELSSLLKVMVMLDDAPAEFIARLVPPHAELATQGRLLRAQLPSYLQQQWARVVAHCPLPAVLQPLVAAYAATTPEDMWADGLRVRAPRAKRGRLQVEKEDEDDGGDAPPLRRSVRLCQKHAWR
jgi:hypothetical protein